MTVFPPHLGKSYSRAAYPQGTYVHGPSLKHSSHSGEVLGSGRCVGGFSRDPGSGSGPTLVPMQLSQGQGLIGSGLSWPKGFRSFHPSGQIRGGGCHGGGGSGFGSGVGRGVGRADGGMYFWLGKKVLPPGRNLTRPYGSIYVVGLLRTYA